MIAGPDFLGIESDARVAADRLAAAADAARGGVVNIQSGAWSFCLNRASPTLPMQMFSARLVTRGSTELDWAILGQVAALVGVPENHPLPESVRTSPNATHRWIWR